MLGHIETKNENRSQGASDDIERTFLIIGRGMKNTNQLHFVNQETDFEDLIGESELLRNIEAFKEEALQGGSFSGAVYPLGDGQIWSDAVDSAVNSNYKFEFFVVVDLFDSSADLLSVQTKINELGAKNVFTFALVALPSIDSDNQTWAQYHTYLNNIVSDVVAENVMAIPQINITNVGSIAGRLCRVDLSISDTPIRTKSGPVFGLGETPLDSDNKKYTNAQAKAIESLRLTVPQKYAGQGGTYLSDANTLDKATGDYKVAEILRPVLKAMRKVHERMWTRLGDKTLNKSKVSIAAAESFAKKPLDEMAQTIRRDDEVIPGDIYPPQDGDVTIQFTGQNSIVTYLAVRPIDSPKKITNKLYVKREGQL
ncbi:DUF2586 domain-containing protein [Pseudomonas sp. HK3]